jgi:signal transduction histidine kinase
VAHLSEAIRLGEQLSHGAAVAIAYRFLADAHLALGEPEPARACLLHHRALAGSLGQADAVVAATIALADMALAMGGFADALIEVAAAEPGLRDADQRGLWAQAITIRAAALLHLGYMPDPLRLLDQAERTAPTLGDARVEGRIYAHLVPALIFLGRFERAEALCRRGLALAQERGDAVAPLAFQGWAAEVAWRQGDFDGALARAEQAHRSAVPCGAAREQAYAAIVLSRGALAAHRPDEAEAWVQGGLLAATPLGDLRLWAELHWMAGEAALAYGARLEAEAAFAESLNAADQMNGPLHRALALAGLGRCAEGAPDAEGLRTQAAEQLTLYLEQLSPEGRNDFLRHAERRAVLDGGAASVPALPARDSFLGFLTVGTQQDAPGLREAFGRLDDVMGLGTAQLPLEQLLQRMNEAFLAVGQPGRAMLFTFHAGDERRLRDRRFGPDGLIGVWPDGACERVLERVAATGETLWVMDALSDPDFAEVSEVRQLGLRGMLCVPLKVSDGETERVIGCLYGDRQSPWVGVSEREVTLLALMARHLSVAVEMRVLQEESARKAHQLETINSLSKALAGTLDLEPLLDQALGEILQITQGEHGYLFFGQGEDMPCRVAMDRHGARLSEVQVSRSVMARVSRERQPVAILDIGQDEELQSKASLVVRNVRSVMCVPLVREERLIGLVYISSSTTNKTFTRHDLDLMAAIAAQVALALLNAEAYATIKELNAGLEAKVKARTLELERAYEELTQTQDQLVQTEKLATIGTLASGVAHEINNPLGAILSNAQLLQLDTDDPETLDSLSLIEAGARRCREIVEALLKYSHLAKNRHEVIDLRRLTQEALGVYARQLELAEVSLETEFAEVPAIQGDGKEIKQVVTNLLLNALDALREKHGLTGGRLSVRIVRELSGLRLIVSDDGAGMGPEVLKRIFDPFFTTKTVGSGTGLGLSVCQRIIERHGGTIQVTSAPGEGTTFTVELPVP